MNVPADAEGASIAVLPFANMSPEKEQARTSSFAFKGRDVDVREIAAALGVAAILEGSVRKAGDRLRVTAQLVNAADGYHLWSERFDRQLEDVFAVQDEITLAIVEALRVRLLGGERDRLLKRSTENQEAFTLYLKARHHLHTFTTAGLRQAERFSRHAIALDSNYAKAWVSLGAALLFRGGTAPTDDVPPREVYPEARDAINRALQLDGQLAEAHMMLGVLRTWFERDWEGARRAFADALTLKPNDSDVHFWYGQHFWISNRLDDAMHHARIAAAKDPLAIVFPSFVGHVNQCLRRYDEAIAQFEQVLEMEPRFFHALLHLGDVYATTGDYVRAEQCYQRAQDVVGEDSSYLAARQIALATDVGRHEEARTRLEALLERATRRYTPHGFIAIAYLGLGDHDAVFEWLDKAVDEGTGLVCVWATMPWSDPVRSDPRFADLLRRLDLPRSAEG